MRIILTTFFLIPAFLYSEPPCQKYVRENLKHALKYARENGIPVAICLAQGMLESDCGRSNLARINKNNFGMVNGSKARIRGKKFRRYLSAADSFRDWAENLAKYSPYRGLFKIPISDFRGWARGLQRCGYSTSNTYAAVLVRLIERENLDRFDRPFLVGWIHEKIAPC